MIEERSFWFAYENAITLPSGAKVQIDLNSIACAYDYGNGQPLVYDTKVSLLEVKNRRFLLICKDSVMISSYSLLIVAKQTFENRQQVNVNFNTAQTVSVNTIYQYLYPNNDHLLVSFNQNMTISGQFNLASHSLEQYLNSKSPRTNQKPLTLFSVITIDLSNVVVSALDGSQRVSFTFSNSIKDGVDPASLRVALLNESTNSFDLYLGDDDILGIRSWTYDISSVVSKSVTFGLYYYSNNIGVLGEGQLMTYTRSIQYQLDTMVSLTMNYEIPETIVQSNVDAKYKPYLVVSERKVNTILNQGNYTIFKSLIIESGNGLGSLKLKDSRRFTVNSTTKISDINGNTVQVNLATMRCAYLLKETGYSIMELGNRPLITPSSQSYQLNCLEDIRDEDYYLLLVVVPFKTIVEMKDNGKEYSIIPSSIGHYESLWSNNDLFSVQFSPDSNFNGTYSFGLSSAFEFTKLPSLIDKQRLQVIYSLDFKLQDPPKEGYYGHVMLSLSTISDKFNLDPYSFRLMTLDQPAKELKLLYEDVPYRGPWEVKINPEANLSFKLAISYNYRLPAELQRQYLINYARKLDYFLQPTAIISFTFQIPSLSPLTVSDIPTFKVEEGMRETINLPSYEILHSLKITQDNVRQYELKPERHLTFFKSHVFTNLEGNKLPNLNISTITCAFILPGSSDVIISKATPIELVHDYDLSCGEHFWGQTYSLYIIGKLLNNQPIPTPSPIQSSTAEVAQYLVRNSTISSTISNGQTKLFSIQMNANEKLTLLFSSFITGTTRVSNSNNLQLFIGIDFVPSRNSYSIQLNSNEMMENFIEMNKDGIVYLLLEAPSSGVSGNSIPFTLSPKIYLSGIPETKPVAKPSSPTEHSIPSPKESNSISLIILICVLSVALLISLCFGVACGVYQRKKHIKMDQYDRYEKELMNNQ